jgi:hypothetical protein
MVAIVALFIWGAPALAAEWDQTPDARAIQAIYREAGSPLPWYTVAAFRSSHPAFDVAGFLAVLWCESGLGTTGKSRTYHNPGNIKFCGWMDPTDPRVWLRWQCGAFRAAGAPYGHYLSHYWGQRAAIRLIWDRGYNEDLAAGDWWGFASRYYGAGVPGIATYVRNLQVAHDRFVRIAASHGCAW